MNTTEKPVQSHTPGPWSHTPMQDTIWANDGETKVATLADLPWVESSSGRRTSDWQTEEANARLIASAPDLLAALQRVLAFEQRLTCSNDGGPQLASDIRAAIAKATGAQ